MVRSMPAVESAGRLLREARRRAGLSQVELGRRAGVTQSVISAYESGRREPSVPVLLRLIGATGHSLEATLVPEPGPRAVPLSGVLGRRVHRLRHDIERIASAHGVANVRVFGSVARGVERPDSDIDLLVDLPQGAGLFALGRLRSELEQILGAAVDVVPSDGVKDDVRALIEPDLVAL
jgi:predicted nucleotidyltransferase/DNA-binding XRE family transcriptional regulator